MDFQELGEALRQEREKKGLSIEMVMDSTKISRTNIVAMENGDRSSLPHPVYAKGFVKSYARFLGLDAEELSMVVDREYQDEAGGPEEHIYEVSPAAEKAFQDKDFQEGKRRVRWPLLLILVLLLAGGGLFFFNLKGKNADTPVPPALQEQTGEQPALEAPTGEELSAPESEAAPPADSELAPQADDEAAGQAADEAVEEVPEAKEVSGDTAKATDEAGVAVTETAASADRAEREAAEQGAEIDEQPAEAMAEKQLYDHVVIIRAITEKGCWIGVWKGDESRMSRDFVLKQGEPLRLMFNSPRRIRIGNVAGVTVTYNGKPYKLEDNKTNIQTLQIGY
ncbi:DUF4115 domain-containing protein [Pseudodesulfovibrio cashew]|uniref:DUF4115 domain-containing protein n=1 Tax=Pseudodesulfovibrio cashew TaxID=2678688 RepID=A0A6I6JJD5_9BACT|nr:helix-turn-helix domain-containing protein [Pseudodesulfovibrio cashew]QGY41249.1 DUF4115 domain-containing protein [Pseudodesulfovibrio cashew]